MKLLIVEDDVFTRIYLEWHLKAMGFSGKMKLTTNGIEAIELLNNFQPDIIILDVHMPDANGFDVLNSIKTSNLTPKVYMISGYMNEKDYNKSLEYNCVEGFYHKPIRKSTLKKLILNLQDLPVSA